MKDLIITVADSQQEKVLEALLPRIPVASQTSEFTYEIIKNIGNDPGSYHDSHELLRPYINQYHHAIVVFDYEGTGIENTKTREEAEINVESHLNRNGWQDRNAVIVIKPELENWIWIDNTNVHDAIGWERQESLYDWARNKGLIIGNNSKPERPKESFELALRLCQTAMSSAIYKKIASTVSYQRCEDPAFQKLISKLQEWFPLNRLIP